MFQKVQGRLGRIDFDRAANPPEVRKQQAENDIAAMKANLKAERLKYLDDQQRDRAALSDRHRQEDQQLDRAVAARVGYDRAAEVAERHEQVRGITRDLSIDRQQGPGMSPTPQ